MEKEGDEASTRHCIAGMCSLSKLQESRRERIRKALFYVGIRVFGTTSIMGFYSQGSSNFRYCGI